MDISNFCFLIVCVFFAAVAVVVVVFFFLALKTTEGLFFQRVHLYLWAVAVYELNKLNVYEPRVLIAD